MEVFEFPTVGDEFGGEVVEQLRVGGFAAEEAEVTGRIDDAGAEVVLPDTVGEDSRCEGVFVTGDPLGEGEAALAFVGVEGELVGFGDLIEDGEAGGNDGVTGFHGVAAFMDGGGFFGLGVRADPHLGKRGHGVALRLGGEDLLA